MELLINLIVIYLGQMGVCAIVNAINTTRIPKTVFEYIKLTFLPYLLLHLKKYRLK